MLFNGIANAQLSGKQFISGSAGLTLSSYKPNAGPSPRGYGYALNISTGKFTSDTKAVGWSLSHELNGGKNNYITYQNNTLRDNERKGLIGFSLGMGRFWQFYKHLSSKFGVYGGPDINVGFAYARSYSVEGSNSNYSYMHRKRTNKIALYAGLSAGAYYKFSEKWWVTAGLAFSNPVSIEYAFNRTSVEDGLIDGGGKDGELTYRLSPSFSIPSVNFGLRYFL